MNARVEKKKKNYENNYRQMAGTSRVSHSLKGKTFFETSSFVVLRSSGKQWKIRNKPQLFWFVYLWY